MTSPPPLVPEPDYSAFRIRATVLAKHLAEGRVHIPDAPDWLEFTSNTADLTRALERLEVVWTRVAAEMRQAMGYVQQPDHAHRLHVAYDRRRRARRRRPRR